MFVVACMVHFSQESVGNKTLFVFQDKLILHKTVRAQANSHNEIKQYSTQLYL